LYLDYLCQISAKIALFFQNRGIGLINNVSPAKVEMPVYAITITGLWQKKERAGITGAYVDFEKFKRFEG
jgi:hypothetical protein